MTTRNSLFLLGSGTLLLLGLAAFAAPPNLTAPPPPGGKIDTTTNDARLASPQTFANGEGAARTLSTDGFFDLRNPFFLKLGTNGRACATCHQLSDGMSVSPEHLRQRFDSTKGTDPVFRLNDGANAPNADVATLDARHRAYNMLLSKGLFRVHMPIPDAAEFVLDAVDDPYHYASAADVSLFRRPLPTTNLRFLASVMWDGREGTDPAQIHAALMSQARDAVTTHAEGAAPSESQLQQIVAFETKLFTTQAMDSAAGALDANGAHSGPEFLTGQEFYPGVNDPFADAMTAAARTSFSLYGLWAIAAPGLSVTQSAARAAIRRGEALFNTRTFTIANVPGLNDALNQPRILGTCATCHNAPNVGSHSRALFVNTGVSDGARRTADLPLYTLRNKTTGEIAQTTDPGRALVTGRWADLGKFKVPSLRGIESRSPYMHNAMTDDIGEIVEFYNVKFSIGLTDPEKLDLAAFIKSL